MNKSIKKFITMQTIFCKYAEHKVPLFMIENSSYKGVIDQGQELNRLSFSKHFLNKGNCMQIFIGNSKKLLTDVKKIAL